MPNMYFKRHLVQTLSSRDTDRLDMPHTSNQLLCMAKKWWVKILCSWMPFMMEPLPEYHSKRRCPP